MNFKLKINGGLQKGQSLFEVVVASAITALIITAIVSLASNSIQNSSFSRDKTLAANYVQQTNEWLRQERDKDAKNFIAKAAIPTWCFTTLSWTRPSACGATEYISGTKFVRQSSFTISVVDGKNLVQIDTVVSWRDSKGLRQVKSSTNLSVLQ
ncbi:MAG: hypothetical protein WA125_07290 [Desulfosporosinus sp.]